MYLFIEQIPQSQVFSINKCVSLTGTTGFIGYRVIRLLREQQCDIRALIRHDSEVAELKTPGVELTRISLPGRAGTIASST